MALSGLEFFIGNSTGIFADEGIDIEEVVVRNPVEGVDAVIAGEADFTPIVGSSILAAMQGAPIKIVMIQNRLPLAFLTRNGISDIEDCETVATSGGIPNYLIRQYFESRGLEEYDNYTLTEMPPPAAFSALLNGQVDGAAIEADMAYVAMNQGCTFIFNLASEFPDIIAGGLAVSEALIENNPELVTRMVKALYRTYDWMQQNKDEAIDIPVNAGLFGREEAQFKYEYCWETTVYGSAAVVEPSARLLDDMVEATMQMYASIYDLDVVPVAQITDTTFLDEVLAELAS
jgi:NitT/TauT family transport system substrate-binding protein